MRRAWVPSGFIASLVPKQYAVGMSVSAFGFDVGLCGHARRRPAVADVEHFKIEREPVLLVDTNSLANESIRPRRLTK